MGRQQAIGRFDTRAELEEKVRFLEDKCSTKQIAKNCEISVGTVYNILYGRNPTSRDRFEAWAAEPPRGWYLDRIDSTQGDDDASPGQYVSYAVQCAWEAWQAK